MKTPRKLTVIALGMVWAVLFTAQALAQPARPAQARNVVLVHGAWADGSSWSEVIARLQAAGLHVTAVQNPLTSLADSVAATRRALALQDGPTVLVGHSWSGTVVSETGTDPKVTALVYVAARAPDAAEDFVALSGKFPTMPARAGVQEHAGFAYLSEDAFLQYFANGVAREKAEVLYAAQEPPAASLFGERTSVAAWRSKPSWYAVSKLDQTISPDLERFLAQRMKATTVELDAGHLSLVSHAQEITELILAAAGSPAVAPAADKEPLDAQTLNTIKSEFGKLMELANRHDFKALHGMFWQSPSTLLVAKSAIPAEGNWAGFWGNEAIDQKLHDIGTSGPVVLEPDYSKLKVVGLTPDVAESYAPMTITVSYAGQDGTPKPFLMIINWRKVGKDWKVASEIILPIPPAPAASPALLLK